jgi:hypothetical protein
MDTVVMRRVVGVGLAVVATLGVAACGSSPQVQWGSNLSATERQTLADWLFCVDCPPTGNARAAAAALGDKAIDALSAVLVGPPDAWRATMKARYVRMARRIGRAADSTRIAADYLAEFDAAAQRRSALSLGDIGTPRADSVLRAAIADADARGYRRDVVRALHEGLLTSTAARYDGSFSTGTPRFLDTVRLRRGTLAWDGDESVSLHGAPFPDDLVVRRWNNDSLAFVAAGQTGRYAISVTNIGVANTEQWDTVVVRSFPAAPWTTPRDIVGASFPLTIHQSLARITTPKDTIHSYRFRPPADLTITASVAWTGPSTIATTWEDCADRSFPGTPMTVSGVVVDQAGVPLGGSQVALVGTALGAVTNALGQFFVINVTPGWQGDLRAQHFGYAQTLRPGAEGRAGYWLVLPPPGPPPAPFVSQPTSGPSPNNSSLTIPGGACRLFSIIKTDSATPSVIARLRLTSP